MACAEQLGAHLVLAAKVNEHIFQREAPLLTQAGQHVFDKLSVTCGSQGSAVIWQEDTTVTTFHPRPTSTFVPLLWRTRDGFSILG